MHLGSGIFEAIRCYDANNGPAVFRLDAHLDRLYFSASIHGIVEDLLSADEAFFTGTAAEVTPIREVDGKQIGTQERGPITYEIQQAFFAATSGQDPRYKHWLHSVGQPAAAVS